MTWRVVWISPENWWPEHRDFNTHHEADQLAANTTGATIHQLGDPCPTKTTPANSAENNTADAPHDCDAGHFDRTICPEPCGWMHSYCTTCGSRQDACHWDQP